MMDLFKVRVGVAVFNSKGEILLARQNKRPFWVLPGGTLEKGETIGACAIREIKEEANLEVTLGPLLYVADFFASDGKQVIDIVFQGHVRGGVLKRETSENLDDIAFFAKADLQSMDVRPRIVFESLLQDWDRPSPVSATYLGHYG